MNRLAIIGLVALSTIVGAGVTFVVGQHSMQGHGMHNPAHHGGQNAQHDMERMPMLNGENTTPNEVADLRKMFLNHPDITRSVEMIPGGIRTVTETQNDDLRDALVSHVAVMIARVETGDDPKIPIQSPTLAILFERGDTIVTDIEPTDFGVMVTQTSTDPEVVAALQTHATEVSDLAARGMQAVHEQMMGQHH